MGREMAVVPVGPFPRSVVAAAILIVVVPNAGGEGCGQRLRVSIVSRIIVVLIGGDWMAVTWAPPAWSRSAMGLELVSITAEMRANR